MTTTDPGQSRSTDELVPDQLVPDSVIPHGQLPPMSYRDLPEPIAMRKMMGPSIILAGLALGSGEFVLWPYITFQTKFIFFWACILGVTMQYFINMEITRWTLATGESAITGFCRISKHWAWIFLLFNIVPWFIPAWSTAGAQLLSWLLWPEAAGVGGGSPYVVPFSIGSLLFCGIVLTAGPVVYETVEKTQFLLVGFIMLLVVILAALFVRADAIAAMGDGLIHVGRLPDLTSGDSGVDVVTLLGALAFAGVGGTLNLGQSNYVKDKGYGMGHYIGRITSPITGQAETLSEVGYHFPDTEDNRRRWRSWWRRSSVEHFFSFYLTCVVCLVLLSLLTYSVFYRDGARLDTDMQFGAGEKLDFIRHQATQLGAFEPWFLVMGVAILFTTELCVLDATSRISADILKVNWLRSNEKWTESRLYSLALWGVILGGSALLLWAGTSISGFMLVKIAAALNGGVMFFYCVTLLILNRRKLPPGIRMGRLRQGIMLVTTLFFGFFACWVLWDFVSKKFS